MLQSPLILDFFPFNFTFYQISYVQNFGCTLKLQKHSYILNHFSSFSITH
jgi:hypothetical protein